jgi:predicted Zn-dependent protease with MMP-like domain
MYLALGNRPLADAEFRTIQFTSRAKVEIGEYPNCITIWR